MKAITAGSAASRVIIRAKPKGRWRPSGEERLARVAAVVPQDWTVIVAADQGWSADWLCPTIPLLGGHPMRRVHRWIGEGEAIVVGIGKRVQRRGRGEG